jgi:dolichol-phosphate mannosyltransferase
MPRPALSLVLPVFDEEDALPALHQRLKGFVAKLALDVEVVFVDDGSRDRSRELLRGMAAKEGPEWKVVSLSRNFGKQAAVSAGLDYAQGSAVIVLSADLEDPPEVVLEMIERWRAGFDVVHGQRIHREDEGLVVRLRRSLVRRTFKAFVPLEVPLDGDFRLLDRKVVLALRALRESHRFVRGMVSWLGFKQTSVLYERAPRTAGATKQTLGRRLALVWDGVTSLSLAPLRLATWLGLFVLLTTMGAALVTLGVSLLSDHALPPNTGIALLVCLFAGVQLSPLGILGAYVGRIYEQSKRRPLYVVEDWVNLARAGDTEEPDEDARARLPATVVAQPHPAKPVLKAIPRARRSRWRWRSTRRRATREQRRRPARPACRWRGLPTSRLRPRSSRRRSHR